jgi:hypothetical protein
LQALYATAAILNAPNKNKTIDDAASNQLRAIIALAAQLNLNGPSGLLPSVISSVSAMNSLRKVNPVM